MANMRDMARMMAAEGLTGAEGAPIEPGAEETAPEIEPKGPAPMEDFEAGIGMIEGALAGVPEEQAARVMELLEGLKAVASEIEAAAPEEAALDEMPPPEGSEAVGADMPPPPAMA